MQRALVVVLAAGIAVASCSNGPAGITGPSASVAPPPLDAALAAAYVEEIGSQRRYERVILDFGAVLPFVNIVRAEAQHAEAVRGLLVSRGLPLPGGLPTIETSPAFASVPAACAGSAQAERDNVAFYDRWLQGDLPEDVRTAFEGNRRASLTAHLPAFERCR